MGSCVSNQDPELERGLRLLTHLWKWPGKYPMMVNSTFRKKSLPMPKRIAMASGGASHPLRGGPQDTSSEQPGTCRGSGPSNPPHNDHTVEEVMRLGLQGDRARRVSRVVWSPQAADAECGSQ